MSKRKATDKPSPSHGPVTRRQSQQQKRTKTNRPVLFKAKHRVRIAGGDDENIGKFGHVGSINEVFNRDLKEYYLSEKDEEEPNLDLRISVYFETGETVECNATDIINYTTLGTANANEIYRIAGDSDFNWTSLAQKKGLTEGNQEVMECLSPRQRASVKVKIEMLQDLAASFHNDIHKDILWANELYRWKKNVDAVKSH